MMINNDKLMGLILDKCSAFRSALLHNHWLLGFVADMLLGYVADASGQNKENTHLLLGSKTFATLSTVKSSQYEDTVVKIVHKSVSVAALLSFIAELYSVVFCCTEWKLECVNVRNNFDTLVRDSEFRVTSWPLAFTGSYWFLPNNEKTKHAIICFFTCAN